MYRSIASFTLVNSLSRIGYWASSYEDRYLSRRTIGSFRGLSIGIVSNSRVKAVTTIAFYPTSMLVKVYIDTEFWART